MNNRPLVSIIMPAYNAQSFIEEAIISVIDQTYDNWELIIINDGCTDETIERIKRFDDIRIKTVFQENGGVSSARNLGLSLIQGQYLCFLDADDILPPNSIQSRITIFDQIENISFVDGKVDFLDTELKKIIKTYLPNFKGNPLKELIYLTGKCFVGQTWMLRVNDNLIPFKKGLTHGEDLLFYIQNSLKNEQYSYTDEVVLKYRQNSSSAMKNIVGLEKGYEIIWNELRVMNQIPIEWSRLFRKKTKMILFKSYLKNKEFIKAFKVLIKK
jgi:glycosyltransferase involved in cell wall biosynthesis